MRKRYLLLLGIGLFILGIIRVAPASLVAAQESPQFALSISPPTFELSANPGDSLSNSIRVSNLTDRPLTIAVDLRNFTAVGEEGAIGLTEEETGFSLASWIGVTPQEIEIPPNTNQNFSFNINVPLNAEPGGHFGSIVFKTGGGTPEQTGAALAQEVGALILLRVAGQAKESASIESFSPVKDFFEYGPVELETRVKNEGNVHVRPTGTITISNMFGQKVADIELESRNVLPGAIRRLSGTLDEKNLIGRYTATVHLTYGNQGQKLSSTTTFTVFPYKIGGAVFAGLLLLAALLWRGRKRIKYALKVLFSGPEQKEQ